MNFGAEFHDDVFERPRGKREKSPPRRGAKILYPKWFLDPVMKSSSEEEELQCLRHKADYLYFSKNFTEAASLYENFLTKVPETNIPCQRECMENISRCYLHSESADRALEWALKLNAISANADQKIVSFNLVATVCHALGKYEEELEALHMCLEPHKSNPDMWNRLAYCYSGMFKIPLPNSDPKLDAVPRCCDFKSRLLSRNSSEPSSTASATSSIRSAVLEEKDTHICDVGPKDTEQMKCEMCTLGIQMVSACLIRARILSSSTEKNHCSEKYSKINEEITKCLNYMEVEESFIEEASNMLKSEMLVGIQLPDDEAVT